MQALSSVIVHLSLKGTCISVDQGLFLETLD